MTKSLLAATLCSLALFAPALAVEPDEMLPDPVMEARAREISVNVRCVVCQSQNIDDSNAPLAKDMRLIVRERLIAGDSDEEIYRFLVARYGDYVLLKPRIQANTLILWAAPMIIFSAALLAAGAYLAGMRRVKVVTPSPRSNAVSGDGGSAP